jgi:hypothetical protein
VNVPNESKDILLDPYKAFRAYLGQKCDVNPQAVELPKTNIPSGYPTELEAVSNFNAAAFGVSVAPSVILGGLPDGAVKEGNGRGLHHYEKNVPF